MVNLGSPDSTNNEDVRDYLDFLTNSRDEFSGYPTCPFLLKEFPADLQDGEVVIFAGFGVGLTSSVIVYGAVQ